MGRRPGRAAARRANAAIGLTPRGFESLADDEQLPEQASSPEAQHDDEDDDDERDDDEQDGQEGDEEDGDGDGDGGDDDEGGGDGENEGNDDEEEGKTEGAESEGKGDGDGDGEMPDAPAPEQQVIRRKRLGRPPKNKPPDWDLGVVVQPGEDVRPKRGRGGYKGRGGRKGNAPPTKLTQVIDKDGTQVDIVDDECLLPEDAEGETKIDKLGYLKGDRDYRCRTFKVHGRGDRLYMLSTEPARCVGFRDSYLFFTKHLRLYKIIVGEDEKKDMIDRDIIPHSYRGRSIGIVTARSVFREFGSRIIIGGKKIVDDYQVAQAREEGAVEGELADPTDVLPADGEPYNKNQYVAWHGASTTYGGPGMPPVEEKKPAPVSHRKRKPAQPSTSDFNWMYDHAMAASTYNSALNASRRSQEENGVYDIYTNMMFRSANTQPTRARAEPIPLNAPSTSTIFPTVPRRIARNFYVADMICERPSSGIAPSVYHGPSPQVAAQSNDMLSSFRGLGAVSDEIVALLPEECRASFQQARAKEKEWVDKWPSEEEGMARRAPQIDKAIVPYQMS